jgi:Fucose 4-O-acetylase and related acetyltransferases
MRGIGIVLMVLGHSGFPGTDYIYLFHMALFFMLSGWFFSLRGGLVHFVRRKLVTLWLPFVAANTVFTVCNNPFSAAEHPDGGCADRGDPGQQCHSTR